MDGRKNNGGHSTKGRAGRKPKEEEIKIIELLDKNIDKEKPLQELKKLVDEGNLKAIQLYLSYRYGRPTEFKKITIDDIAPIFQIDED